MDEIQAAMLRVKLGHLDAWNAARTRLAARYFERLPDWLGLPPRDGVFHLFVVTTSQRDALRQHLSDQGIGTDIHYPLPAHLQRPYADGSSLPNTERLAREVLSLPIYPELSEASVDYVCETVGAYGA
jgi:dTDP-4-amino-4,6-dideoxygalactose transaminase